MSVQPQQFPSMRNEGNSSPLRGSFEATLYGEDRATVAGWFVGDGWQATEVARGNWIVVRGKSELIISLKFRYDRPLIVSGILEDVNNQAPQICDKILSTARFGYTARWFDMAGVEMGAMLVEVLVNFDK